MSGLSKTLKIVSENLNQFKRGQNPQKSLGIGRYREIPLTYPIDIDKIPLGTYIATRKDLGYAILEFKDGGDISVLTYWFLDKSWPPNILSKSDFRPYPLEITHSRHPEGYLENLDVIKIQRYDIKLRKNK